MSYHKIISSLLATTVLACSAFADGILDANSATAEELSDIGENAAAVIVEGRPFKTIGELNAALGSSMSEDDLEALYEKVFVPIELNSASREDILLIPGVGGRMAHEFEEYRPYTSTYNLRLIAYSVAESASSAAAAELVLRHGTSNSAPLLTAPVNLDANGYGHFACDIVCPAGIWIERVTGETTVVLYTEHM